MGEEVRITDHDISGGDDDSRVMEWEAGLPNVADLPPLSHTLISSELASAFSISPEPHWSMLDVDRASRDTLSSIRGQSQHHLVNKLNDFRSLGDDRGAEMAVEGDETVDLSRDGSPSRKLQRVDSGGASGGPGEEADSALRADDSSGRTSKRNRLVWTPQLHKRFIEVVAHLGVKNAVPKTIMQLMNVEGLSRENVASHLQKYRLYLKRKQGSSNELPSPSDHHLFASTPVPKSSHDSGSGSGNENWHSTVVPIPKPYLPPQIVPSSGGGGGGGGAYHNGFEYHPHPYNMMMQPKDWPGNSIASVPPYQHRMTPNHK